MKTASQENSEQNNIRAKVDNQTILKMAHTEIRAKTNAVDMEHERMKSMEQVSQMSKDMKLKSGN